MFSLGSSLRRPTMPTLADGPRPAGQEVAMTRQAYSPRDLAERWQCSERHVRNLLLTRGACTPSNSGPSWCVCRPQPWRPSRGA